MHFVLNCINFFKKDKVYHYNLLNLSLFLILSYNFPAQSDSNITFPSDSNFIFSPVPFFNSGDEAESGIEEQEIAPLLQSSPDVFLQYSMFQFIAGRYRFRGYPAKFQNTLFNGISVNNLETGYTLWNQWGGLNDITRRAENQIGIVSSRYSFSGPVGYVNIDSKATGFRKGTRLSYSFGNRLFSQRVMFTHSTGLMENGWAFTVSGSWRYGDEVYVPGTFLNSKAIFIAIDKRLNKKHLLSFNGVSAVTSQGRASPEQKEVYKISGNNYYNSYWGLQNGKVRNSSVSQINKPILILGHDYYLRENSIIRSRILYTYGKSGVTALNWNDAPNPRPNYYRYLPSYLYSQGDTINGNALSEQWAIDVNTSQINWDKMIHMNQQNIYALPGEGIVSDQTRARYILENRIENLKNLGFSAIYNGRFDKLFISAGFNANLYRNRKYKEMEDLLGATYWLDYDQFADNLGIDNDFQQNDLEHPDKKIFTGDRFGYDYSINMDRTEIWFQNEYNFNKIDIYSGLSLSAQKVWREGFVANGKFPNSSKGISESLQFFNYGLKFGFTYKLNGRHFLTGNGLIQTRAPEANSLFISPRTRNDLVTDLESEQQYSGDVNYQIKYPGLKLRLTGYITEVKNQTWLRSYWHDEYNNNVNLIMKNLDQRFTGIELGLEKILFTEHQLQLAFSYGYFCFSNRPVLEAWQDNNNVQLYSNRISYLQNYRIGGAPQSVLGLGYRYNSHKHWYAGIYYNAFYQLYTDINPERRTAEALEKYLDTEAEYYQKIIAQEQLPSYFILNASAGKSFRNRRKHYFNINLQLYNILNNKNHITSGFEQLRWDKNDLSRFDNKYYYMQGFTFMLNVSFTFN